MQAFYILLTVATVALGSAGSATLPASGPTNEQEAEFATTSSTVSQLDTGRYICICNFVWYAYATLQELDIKMKSEMKIQSSKTRLLQKSFILH